MIARSREDDPAVAQTPGTIANGTAVAAFLGAGIGAFAMGFFVLANEAGLLPAPSLYGPAGGVSGRTTFAAVTWLIAWAVLHRRWTGREVDGRRMYRVTLLLIVLGVVATFPPLWALF